MNIKTVNLNFVYVMRLLEVLKVVTKLFKIGRVNLMSKTVIIAEL